MFGEAIGLGPAGYMALQAVFGVLLTYSLLVVLERATGDRVNAFLLAATAAMTYGGVVSFVETRGYFDGIALALVLLALAVPHPAVVAGVVFVAGWTDERAMFASGFVLAYFAYEWHVARRGSGTVPGSPASGLAMWRMGAVCVGGLAYGATRVAVAVGTDLPQDTDGFGFDVLSDQINNIAVGLWTGLEGLWLILAFAVLLMWRARMRLLALMTVAVAAVVAVVAVSVVDITRSMAYLLPSVALAALVTATMVDRRTLQRLSLVCLAVSTVWPIYYVGGKHSIWMSYPLPVQIVRWVTGVGG